MNKNESRSGGIGFFGLLTLLFIGLKLSGHIHWSWWVVLAPTWLTFVVVFLALFFVALIEAAEQRRFRR